MAKGRKTGGRQKGTPNRLSSTAREAFLATFSRLAPDIESWIQQTANGWDEEVTIGRGERAVTAIKRIGKDPGKAADLMLRMAEYHFPKLGRQEHVGEDGGAVQVVIQKYSGESDA